MNVDSLIVGMCVGALSLFALQMALALVIWKWRGDDEKFESVRKADLAREMQEIHADDYSDSGSQNGRMASQSAGKEVP
jgi:hypothetical protein